MRALPVVPGEAGLARPALCPAGPVAGPVAAGVAP
jgi:hypothetical protein